VKGQVVTSRYAEALYEEATEQGKLDEVMEGLSSIAALVADSDDLKEIIRNPLISKTDKEAVITALKEKNLFGDFLYDFLRLLARKGRLAILEDLYAYLNGILMDEKGEAEAVVTVAAALDADSKAGIEAALTKATGKKITVTEKLDKEILGGFVAKVGSNLYDASIKGQLDKIKSKLIS